jgi:hypothetical protein
MEPPGRYLGRILVAMSFHANKSFSTGEGGCVVCDDPAMAERVTKGINFGFFDSASMFRLWRGVGKYIVTPAAPVLARVPEPSATRNTAITKETVLSG